MKKFFIACEDANHVCDKSQYKEATFLELIKLNLHLMYCAACRKYSANNAKLSKLFKNKQVSLDDSSKIELQKKIEEQLKKTK
jgi:predicted anti-sigma-YlaC factor YlaD